MAETFAPTYREEQAERPRYVCLVPDSSQEGGTCGFWTWDEEALKQHLQQRHAGLIVKAPDGAGDVATPGAEPLMLPASQEAAPPSPAPESDDIPDPVPPASER